MIDTVLRRSLAGFDDAALATLANPGLVRRAHRDVEEGKLRLVSAGGDGKAIVEADGQLVTLDARGPRAAVCTCRSVSVCRHRIAAVLFLQGLESRRTAEASVTPQEIVEALDLAGLERWSGKAGWRAALELVASALQVEPSPDAIAVFFEGLDEPVRILRGQGFDGIVSKAAKPRAKAYHAAAVLAARRHFGAALPEPAEEAASAAAEIDAAFLDRIAACLCEVATSGFNFAPLPLEESLFELSVSSRADNLPRLSAMLRALAAQLRLRRQRALGFDPDRMLEVAATAHTLTRALPGAGPDRWAILAGKVRRDFAPAAPLSLVGCDWPAALHTHRLEKASRLQVDHLLQLLLRCRQRFARFARRLVVAGGQCLHRLALGIEEVNGERCIKPRSVDVAVLAAGQVERAVVVEPGRRHRAIRQFVEAPAAVLGVALGDLGGTGLRALLLEANRGRDDDLQRRGSADSCQNVEKRHGLVRPTPVRLEEPAHAIGSPRRIGAAGKRQDALRVAARVRQVAQLLLAQRGDDLVSRLGRLRACVPAIVPRVVRESVGIGFVERGLARVEADPAVHHPA